MLIRLWHLLVGHRWKVDSFIFNGPFATAIRTDTGTIPDDMWMCVHGFTVISRSCDCGARDTFKLIGDHVADPEVEELRRMIK